MFSCFNDMKKIKQILANILGMLCKSMLKYYFWYKKLKVVQNRMI